MRSDSREEIFAQLVEAKNNDALFATIDRQARALGFEYSAFGIRDASANSETWLTSKPREWVQRYYAKNYFAVDPVMAHLRSSELPLVWDSEQFPEQREYWEDAKSQGMRYGWSMTAWGLARMSASFCFARSTAPISRSELDQIEPHLIWLAHTACAAATYKNAADPGLTPRELEVLRWTAVGKTAHQIAALLSISERTANFHITEITRKLGAVNKTQASVKAAILGLLK
jgi:LuxR family transcriptional regulator